MNKTFKILGAFVLIGIVIKYLTRPQTTIDIMARTIWGEARGEGYNGMLAVANVINNRAKLGGWWGTNIVSVALAKYQFSAWNLNDTNLDKLLSVDISNPQFKTAVEIASGVINGELDDNTNGATHYHTMAVNPKWKNPDKEVARIGGHIFYRGIS